MKLTNKKLLWECIIIFGLLPPVIAAFKPHSIMYVFLWIAFLLAGRWLSNNHYRIKEDWNRKALRRELIVPMLWRFGGLSIVLFIFTVIAIPDNLFSLPLQKPALWAMVMILYPVLSVAPQEFLFRSFFFRRYGSLFTTPKSMIYASALAFGWVHILLLNWVAVVFSAIGGVIFASTYMKTRSLAAVCFEHAIYGCMIFTLGLGYYFYHGNSVR